MEFKVNGINLCNDSTICEIDFLRVNYMYVRLINQMYNVMYDVRRI